MSIGLGIVTCDRPDYLKQVLAGVNEHLRDLCSVVLVESDGPCRRGVAHAKNQLFKTLLKQNCEYIFIGEDDVVPQSPSAIEGYIATSEATGIQHFQFHGHGTLNLNPIHQMGNYVTIWPNSVGAWCMYTARSLQRVGLMDEHFYNALEHVEHSIRLANAGYCPTWPGVADATGSEMWLKEIPGSIENSVIRQGDWMGNFEKAKDYWQRTKPDTYHQVFG